MIHLRTRSMTDLDVDGSYEWRLAVEVSRVDHVIFAGVQDELCQVDLSTVDGVEQGGTAGRQALAVVAMTDLRRVRHHTRPVRALFLQN